MGKTGIKITDKQINAIKMLRSHGVTFNKIGDYLGISRSTAYKYGEKVTLLPKSMRKNPFELLDPEAKPDLYDKRVVKPEDYNYLKNKEYWIESYEIGTPLKVPNLDMFSLTELQELMEEPTDYHSPLSMSEWAQRYLEGPKNFLKYAPYKWAKGQLEIFDIWE